VIRALLWIVLVLSALVVAARAIAGPFRLGVSVGSPMTAEGIFALSGAGLLACARGADGASATTRKRRKNEWLAVLLLALTAFAAYAGTLHFPFLADDYDHIPHAIHANASYLAGLFTHPAADRFFRPAAFVLYAAEARIAGYSEAAWHALSLAIHVAVSSLVYLFARRRGFRHWTALAAAMLFLLHGSRPEAVTWIAAQFDLWAAFFVLLALLAFERGSRAASLAPLLLALLSKESAFVYPLLLLWMLWIDGVPMKRWARLAGPAFALTGAVFLYRWRLLGGIGGYRDIGTGRPYILTFNLLRTGKALTARFAAALVFPINLSHPLEWWLIAALIAAMAAGAALCAASVERRRFWFGLGFLVLASLPVHEFLLIDADLEKSRVLYLPTVGLALMFAAALEAARVRVAAAAACAILIFQLAALEHNLRVWESVSGLAERTCASIAAVPGPVALSDIANTVDGVYFLHTGLRGCVEKAGKRELYLAGEIAPLDATTLVWDGQRRSFQRAVR
jgi:hypothetical protein